VTDETIELIARANPYPSELPALPIALVVARLHDEPAAVPGRPWSRPRGRRTVLALATAIPVAAVVVAIALLGHSGRGQPDAANLAPPVAVQPSPAVKAAVGALTSILGVLRRSQTASDLNPALIRQLRQEYHDGKYATLHAGLDGLPVLSLMRLATVTPWGQRIYVVPFLPPTPAQKHRLPRTDRSSGNIPTSATVAIYPMSGDTITYFFGTAADPAYINGGRALGNGAYDTKLYNHPRQVIMVVPDGVSKVALWAPTGAVANHPKHPTTPGSKPVVVSVHNNVAAFIAPRTFERPHLDPFSSPGQEIWYGPSGDVVKRIDNASSCQPPLNSCH
jgi:hypothetical protein